MRPDCNCHTACFSRSSSWEGPPARARWLPPAWFLAQRQESSSSAVAIELVILKLIAQPLIAWYFAFHVFNMPPLWAKSAVILSALPTGTGPFMLAELYGKGGGIASRTIFLTTVLGILTLSVWLTIL